MAQQARDYMDVLEERYGFAPANSQEEVFAAQTIAEQLQDHGLATTTEEFSASSWGKRIYGVPMILLFVGVVMLVIPQPVVRIVGFVIALVCALLLVAYRFGYGFLAGIGPRAQSQNIIAVRRASGVPDGERPGRPVVVVAHYDTGREDLLSRPGSAAWRSRIAGMAPYATIGAIVLAIVQFIPILPSVARYVVWALACLCALPLLVWGIDCLMALTGPFTAGSVDNKSGVAAMLSVADKVVYGTSFYPNRAGMKPSVRRRRRPEERADRQQATPREDTGTLPEAELSEPAEPVVEAPVPEPEPAEPGLPRHGEATLRALNILPATCEIVYVEPERPAAPAPAEITEQDEAYFGQDEDSDEYDDYEDDYYDELDAYEDDGSEAPEPSDDPDWGVSDFAPSQGNAHRSLLFDLPDPAVAAVDPLDVGKSTSAPARPVNPEDFPEEDFDVEEQEVEVAPTKRRRPASRPRPSRASFAEDDFGAPQAAAIETEYEAEDLDTYDTFDVLDGDEEEALSPVMAGTRREYKRAGGVLSRLFGGRRAREEQSMSDWLGLDDDFDASTDGATMEGWDFEDDTFGFGSGWKGGATRSAKLRFVPSVEEERAASDDLFADDDLFGDPFDPIDDDDFRNDPGRSRVDEIFDEEAAALDPDRDDDALDDEEYDDEWAEDEEYDEYDDAYEDDEDYDEDDDGVDYELREAITSMGNEELLTHDIWFLAAGGSELDRAGMKDFVERHRRELRGAFVVNLSCVGAGNLTVITDEGFVPHRRSDRRLVRTIQESADTLRIPLSRASMTYGDTDAMPALRASMRAATIMGCSYSAVPAYSHTRDDIPDVVSREAIADVAEIVCEVIRRA